MLTLSVAIFATDPTLNVEYVSALCSSFLETGGSMRPNQFDIHEALDTLNAARSNSILNISFALYFGGFDAVINLLLITLPSSDDEQQQRYTLLEQRLSEPFHGTTREFLLNCEAVALNLSPDDEETIVVGRMWQLFAGRRSIPWVMSTWYSVDPLSNTTGTRYAGLLDRDILIRGAVNSLGLRATFERLLQAAHNSRPLSARVKPDEIRIALWGMKNSGKTSFLARLLILLTESADWHIQPRDLLSLRHAMAITEQMYRGHYPLSTLQAEPRLYVFPIRIAAEALYRNYLEAFGSTGELETQDFHPYIDDVLKFELECLDLSGECYERLEENICDLNEIMRESSADTTEYHLLDYFATCNGLLLMVDHTQPVGEISKQSIQNMVTDMFFQLHQRVDPNADLLNHFVGWCHTKVDRLPPELQRDPNRLGTEKFNLSLEKIRGRLLNDVHEDRLFVCNVSVAGLDEGSFPISRPMTKKSSLRSAPISPPEQQTESAESVGRESFDPKKKPYNVLEPLVWMLHHIFHH